MKNKSELIINLKRSWKYAKNHKKKFYGFIATSSIMMLIGIAMPALFAIQLKK